MTLKAAEGDAPAVVIAYGKFIQTCIDFLIISFAIFMGLQGHQHPEEEAGRGSRCPSRPHQDQELLTEIRDLLKSQQEITVSSLSCAEKTAFGRFCCRAGEAIRLWGGAGRAVP